MIEHLKNLILDEIDRIDPKQFNQIVSDLNENKTNAFKAAQKLYNILRNNEKNGF
jgi:hypothetical protein